MVCPTFNELIFFVASDDKLHKILPKSSFVFKVIMPLSFSTLISDISPLTATILSKYFAFAIVCFYLPFYFYSPNKRTFRGPADFSRGLDSRCQAKICEQELASVASHCLHGASRGPPVGSR